jgi:hypothetical protein
MNNHPMSDKKASKQQPKRAAESEPDNGIRRMKRVKADLELAKAELELIQTNAKIYEEKTRLNMAKKAYDKSKKELEVLDGPFFGTSVLATPKSSPSSPFKLVPNAPAKAQGGTFFEKKKGKGKKVDTFTTDSFIPTEAQGGVFFGKNKKADKFATNSFPRRKLFNDPANEKSSGWMHK